MNKKLVASLFLYEKEAITSFDNLTVVSVSPWLMERAMLSPILADKKHAVVLNGLDTDVFNRKSFNDLREQLGLKNEKIFKENTGYSFSSCYGISN